MTRKIVHKTAISGVTRKFYFILVEIYFRHKMKPDFCKVRAGKFWRALRARAAKCPPGTWLELSCVTRASLVLSREFWRCVFLNAFEGVTRSNFTVPKNPKNSTGQPVSGGGFPEIGQVEQKRSVKKFWCRTQKNANFFFRTFHSVIFERMKSNSKVIHFSIEKCIEKYIEKSLMH